MTNTVLPNRVKVAVTSTGTGDLSLGDALDGYQTFADGGLQTGDLVSYVIEDGNDWEVGLGSFDNTANTMARTLEESSTGSLLDLSGDATVFLTALGRDIITREINVSDNDAGLLITQNGGGDALRVEDQTSPDPSPFVVDRFGRVGIRNATPTVPLDVGGRVVADRITVVEQLNGNGSGLNFDGQGGVAYQLRSAPFDGIANNIRFRAGASAAGSKFIFSQYDNANRCIAFDQSGGSFAGADKMSFEVGPTIGNVSEVMRLTADGKVGIQTPSPSVELEVVGNAKVSGSVTIGPWEVVDDGTGSLTFSVGGVAKMKLDGAGNLSIAGDLDTNATL